MRMFFACIKTQQSKYYTSHASKDNKRKKNQVGKVQSYDRIVTE